jgi:hypothetical protein
MHLPYGRTFRGKIVIMTNDKYPRLSIRLTSEIQRNVKTLAMIRRVSQAHIIRDALRQYFRQHPNEPPRPLLS